MVDLKLIPPNDIRCILSLVKLLNPDTPETILQKRLDEMMQKGYQCLGVYDNKKLVGICGLWTLTKLYIGKHLEPDNVVILPEYRNKGIGELMMAWVDNYAKELDCEAIELNAYVENTKGVEFWKKTGFYIRGYHFQKLIKK